MTLQEMAQALRQQAQATGSITLDDTLLGSGSAFSQAVTTNLLRSQGNVVLAVAPDDIPANPPGSSFSFPAGIPKDAAKSFLALLDNAVQVTISLQGSTFQVTLSIALTVAYKTGNSLQWVFSKSYLNLMGWPFDSILFGGQTFLFVFAPVEPPPGLTPGLNFTASITLTGLLETVQQFLATFHVQPTLGPLKGVITQTAYGPSFDLRASLGIQTLDLTALVIKSPFVGLSMSYIKVQGSEEPYQPSGQVYIGAETSLTSSSSALALNSSTSVDLVTIFRLPLKGPLNILSMSILPSSATSTSLANLGQWMGGQSWNSFFAQPPASSLLPFLESFGLRSYSMQFDLGQFNVASTTLCAGTLQPWKVFSDSDNLIVKQFAVTWTVFKPFSQPRSMLAINCEMDMFGNGQVTFTGSILLPDLSITLALASGPRMTAAQWLQTIVTAFGGGAIPVFLTDALSTFTLSSMLFSLDYAQQTGTYTLVGGLEICGYSADFNLFLSITLKPSFTYDVRISFIFSYVELRGQITNANNTTIVSASWSNTTNPLDLNSIALSLGYDSLGIPPELDLGLTEIGVTYDQTNTRFLVKANSANYGKADVLIFKPTDSQSYVFFGGLHVDKPIDLTNLPLVGQALSLLERVEISDLAVQVSSSKINKKDAGELNQLIDSHASGYPKLPSEGMASTVNVSFVLSLGSYIVPIGIGVGGSSAGAMPPEKSSVQGPGGGDTTGAVPSTSGDKSDGVTWFNLQKAIGPVTFRRLGIRYKDSVLWFLLDASFTAGGLAIDLLGAGIGSPLSDFKPEFALAGLGIDFRQPGLEIGGALYQVPPSPGIDWEYAGGAVIRATKFSLAAYGDYASMSGTPSMFIFAQVTGVFGGPPIFYVTGLAGGFGYNTSLRIPAVSEIYQFPLVAGAQDPGKIGGEGAKPTEVVKVLLHGLDGSTPWITHEIGQYWLAIGVQFTSFEIISTNALIIAEFGKRLLIALLGLSRARFPMEGNVTYARIELQIEILFDPQEGIFALLAELSPNSYLLDPSCRLRGGFAFYMWFPPSPHPYDFVITLGGYHPSFDPAPWYPEVPRVGFTWSLDSSISITGSAYFALTPAAAMAGGELSVTYQQGDLKAWFRAWANMLLYWNPFHFRIDIGVSIGASYRLDLGLTTVTLEAELGANLVLWGPPTGGKATVHWYVISFTVEFGAPESLNPNPLTWPQFQAQLPAPSDIVKIIPGNGLAASGNTDLSKEPWTVRPAGFEFSVASTIPSQKLLVKKLQGTSELQSGNRINIRPMQVTELESSLTIAVTETINNQPVQQLQNWTVTAGLQNVPKAMWGTGPRDQIDPGDDQLVANQLIGFNVIAPAPELNGLLGPVDVAGSIRYNLLSPQGTLPVRSGEPAQGPVPTEDGNTIRTIEEQIALLPYAQARTNLFTALRGLGVDPLTNADMGPFAAAAGAIFTDDPMMVPATS